MGKFCLVIHFVPGGGHWAYDPWYKTNDQAPKITKQNLLGWTMKVRVSSRILALPSLHPLYNILLKAPPGFLRVVAIQRPQPRPGESPDAVRDSRHPRVPCSTRHFAAFRARVGEDEVASVPDARSRAHRFLLCLFAGPHSCGRYSRMNRAHNCERCAQLSTVVHGCPRPKPVRNHVMR